MPGIILRQFSNTMTFDSLEGLFLKLTPYYRSQSYHPFVCSFGWDPSVVDTMKEVSEKRCENRLKAYLIPGELERSDRESRAIRFGHFKKQTNKPGFAGSNKRGRADFCLVGGAYSNHRLTVFYRSLDLLGGLHYDTVIFQAVENALGRIKTITIMSPQAFVAAIPGNSNEKLHRRLLDIYA